MPEHRAIEIEQKTGPNSGQLHVRQHLRLVDWQQTLYCLEFEDDSIFDDNIKAISTVQANRLIDDR